jgi:tetratricopeptide (TPR) repeat protein
LIIGWLWFLGTLVPVIGLVQVGEQAMADRYAYVPLIGIFVMAVWGTADLADSRGLSFRSRARIAGIVLAILSIFTSDQIRYWRSAYDLWAHTVDVTKDNFSAEENLGVALLASDRSAEAEPHFQKAARIRPLDPSSHLNLAGIYATSGRTQDAISEYETALPRVSDPSLLVVAYGTLGKLYSRVGNYSKAGASYQQALRINSEDAAASEGLAKVEMSDAMRNVAESPSGENYFRMGQVLQEAGRTPEARAAYRQALRLNPKLGDAKKALDSLNGSSK